MFGEGVYVGLPHLEREPHELGVCQVALGDDGVEAGAGKGGRLLGQRVGACGWRVGKQGEWVSGVGGRGEKAGGAYEQVVVWR